MPREVLAGAGSRWVGLHKERRAALCCCFVSVALRVKALSSQGAQSHVHFRKAILGVLSSVGRGGEQGKEDNGCSSAGNRRQRPRITDTEEGQGGALEIR